MFFIEISSLSLIFEYHFSDQNLKRETDSHSVPDNLESFQMVVVAFKNLKKV